MNESVNTTSLRSHKSQWYECVVHYPKTQEDGTIKNVSESYVVEALSFTEAETRFTAEMSKYISADFTIKNINPMPFNEVFFSGYPEDDKFYLCKVAFITLDEKSEKEKKSYTNYLIQASTTMGAHNTIDQVMRKSMIDYHVVSIRETKYIDIFEYVKTL